MHEQHQPTTRRADAEGQHPLQPERSERYLNPPERDWFRGGTLPAYRRMLGETATAATADRSSRDPAAGTGLAHWRSDGISVLLRGTGGSLPTQRRGLPALLIRRGGDRILIDCGEGTQRQLLRSIGLTDLDEIFLTHLHADHWLGLPGMLKTFDLRGREHPLYVPARVELADSSAG